MAFPEVPSKTPLPDSSLLKTLALPVAIVLLCVFCSGVAALAYFYGPLAPAPEFEETSAGPVAVGTAGPTPTSILDGVFTNPVNEDVPVTTTPAPAEVAATTSLTATPTVTDTGQAVTTPLSPTVSITSTASLTGTEAVTGTQAATPAVDPTEAEFSTLQLLGASVSILNDTAQQQQAGTLDATQVRDVQLSIEQVLDRITPILSQPSAPDSALAASWTEAAAILELAKQAVKTWRVERFSGDDAVRVMVPVQNRSNQLMANAAAAYAQSTGRDVAGMLQAQEQVKQQLEASLQSASDRDTILASAPVSITFPETDVPLSDALFTRVALAYVTRMVEVIGNYAEAKETLLKYKDQPPKPFIHDPRDDQIISAIATVKASSRIIKQIELPIGLANTRQVLLTALLDCDTSVLYLVSGLKDKSDFEFGLDFLDSCIEKLAQPTSELEAYVASEGASGASAGSAPASVGCPQGCTKLLPGCIIKGKLAEGGAKVFFLPGNLFYNETKLDTEAGDRWFCTVDEAATNGWQAPVG